MIKKNNWFESTTYKMEYKIKKSLFGTYKFTCDIFLS